MPPKRVLQVAAATVGVFVVASIAALVVESRMTHTQFDKATIDAHMGERFRTVYEACGPIGWARCQAVVPGKLNILVVGDSLTVDAYNALYAVFPDANLVLSELTGCAPFSKMDDLLPANFPNRSGCIALNRKRFAPDFLKQFDMIAVAAQFDWYKPEHLEDFLARVRKVNPAAIPSCSETSSR